MTFLYLFMSALIAGTAYLAKLLTSSGAVTAGFFGWLLFLLAPWPAWLAVGFFFLSGGILGYFAKDTIAEKGNRRDGWQVCANLLPSLLSLLLYQATQQPLFLGGFFGGLSGATADTWASEIGRLSLATPYYILSHKPAQTGLSGGVTWLGSIAGFFGAFFLTLLTWCCFWLRGETFTAGWFWSLVFIGLAAMFVDSLLGETLQVKYRCSICGQLTERKEHHQQPTQYVRGLPWLDNDGVNFLSLTVAVLLTWLFQINFL